MNIEANSSPQEILLVDDEPLIRDIVELLNRVAFERAKRHGGRQSVSALLVELVQRHRKELERELQT